MGMGDYSPGSIWYYAPNKAAPIVFIVLFFISGVIHAWQTIKHGSWRTTILLPWAAALMIAGFIIRELGAHHTEHLTYLIASTVLIMSGPPVYALINYFILSRILYYIPYLAPMHPGRVATTFVGLDAVCEILIGQGAWRMANPSMTPKQRKLGANLVTASLSLQVALFGSFGLLAAQFHMRANKEKLLSRDLRIVLYVLYVSATLVTIRCIYRLVEYIEGWDSTIYKNEIFFWIFEAVIMFLNTALLNVFHPGKRLPRSNSVFLDRDGVTERRGPGWADDRPWIVTVFDPFDVWGLFAGRDEKTQFWDMSNEELARLRAEKKNNKRSLLAGAVDPFHLGGPRGYIGKHLTDKKAGTGLQATQMTEASGKFIQPVPSHYCISIRPIAKLHAMKSNRAAWFGAGFVAGAACLFLVELMACYIIPYRIEESYQFDNNPDEEIADVDGPNREQPAANLLPKRDDRQPVVYTYDEKGPTAYLTRTLQRSRNKFSRTSPQETLGRSTEQDNTEMPKDDVLVTVTEVDDYDDHDDDQAIVSTPTESSYKGKGKTPVRTTSSSPTIELVLPTKIDKGKGKGKALVHTSPSADLGPMSSKRLSFQDDESAKNTDQDIFHLASANSKQADVIGNGRWSARVPSATSSASTTQPPPTEKGGRRFSDPILRRQASTSGSQALNSKLL
ncbi:hypothetical protein P171DRAFT_444958 [Karstenula rhodostoma CBS 690.94]|uniref:RTA1-domain-containing protein n=1 Tax=Karstenula rhodostoma CBS 690.94 TaxID=1392251 RepID=A0A9P4U9L1_9PLEO|nr:hypothetical protein P171DRAFT_444958 [Karstenula rhodostoma CBS 690.94]